MSNSNVDVKGRGKKKKGKPQNKPMMVVGRGEGRKKLPVSNVPRPFSDYEQRGYTIIPGEEVFTGINTYALGAFNTFQMAVIPNNLPWLGGLVNSWQRWRFKEVCFTYIPACSEFNTSGSFTMALSFDRVDAAPTQSHQVTAMSHATGGNVWVGHGMQNGRTTAEDKNKQVQQNLCLTVSEGVIDPLSWYRYTTTAVFNDQTTVMQNSLCPFSLRVATSGGDAKNNVGYIWCKYLIEVIDKTPAVLNV